MRGVSWLRRSPSLTHSLQIVCRLNVSRTHFHKGDVDLVQNLEQNHRPDHAVARQPTSFTTRAATVCGGEDGDA